MVVTRSRRGRSASSDVLSDSQQKQQDEENEDRTPKQEQEAQPTGKVSANKSPASKKKTPTKNTPQKSKRTKKTPQKSVVVEEDNIASSADDSSKKPPQSTSTSDPTEKSAAASQEDDDAKKKHPSSSSLTPLSDRAIENPIDDKDGKTTAEATQEIQNPIASEKTTTTDNNADDDNNNEHSSNPADSTSKEKKVLEHHHETTAATSSKKASRSSIKKTKKLPNKKQQPKNELTKLIPGYTAPLKLNTSSLDKYRPTGGIQELQRRAQKTDASTKSFLVGTTHNHIRAMTTPPTTTTSAQKKNSTAAAATLPTSYMEAYSSFKHGTKKRSTPADNKTAGAGWFHMNPTPMTDELKADLKVLKSRAYLDPKKFYKSADKPGDIVQLGTVIEGSSEFFSSRLTKKQRRTNLTEEIMADPTLADYTVNKFKTISREKTAQANKRKKKRGGGKKKFY